MPCHVKTDDLLSCELSEETSGAAVTVIFTGLLSFFKSSSLDELVGEDELTRDEADEDDDADLAATAAHCDCAFWMTLVFSSRKRSDS